LGKQRCQMDSSEYVRQSPFEMGSIAESTVPIMRTVENDVLYWGSGVLLQIADAHFVLSAAHVHRETNPSSLVLPGCGGNGTDNGTYSVHAHRSLAPKDFTDTDPYDILAMRIDAALADAVRRVGPKFLRMTDIEAFRDPSTSDDYCVCGFPGEFNAPSSRGTALLWSTPLYNGPRAPAHKSHGTEILLQYGKAGLDINDSNANLPHPGGMSGCGIWRWTSTPDFTKTPPARAVLVGIQTGWNRAKRYLVGTKIKYVLDLIYSNYPELRPAMDIHYRNP
jgi:hypothetical protein